MDEITTRIEDLTDAERYEDMKEMLRLPVDWEPPVSDWPPRPEDYGDRAGLIHWMLRNAPIALEVK